MTPLRALALLAAASGLLAWTGAVQADVPASSPVLSARLHVLAPLDTALLNVSYPSAPPDGATPGFPCSAPGTVVLQPAYAAFTFREEANEGGCAEVRSDLAVPPGVVSFTVGFRANREILVAVPTPFRAATYDMYQSLRIWDANGTLLQEVHYYDPFAPASNEWLAVEALVPVPANTSRMQVGWYFYDNTAAPDQASVPTPGESFAGTVRDAVVDFATIDLDLAALAYTQTSQHEEAGQRVTRSVLALPLTARQLTGTGSVVTLQLPAEVAVANVTGANGTTLEAQRVRQTTQGAVRSIELGPLGPADAGTFSIHTVEVTTLPPAPPPPAPQRLDGLVVLAFLLPGVLGIGAVVQTHRYRALAVRSQRVPIALLVSLIAVCALSYAAILGWFGWVRALDAMAILPIASRGWRFYIGLGGVAAAFLLVVLVATVERQRARDLRHARDLERSNADLEAFATAASHDLQEPLRDVQNSLLLLDETYGRRVPKEGRRLLHDAEKSAQRLREMMRAILAYARADDLAMQDVPLSGAVRAAMRLVQGRLREAGARVRFTDLPAVHADQAALVRVLENLLSNCLKFRAGPPVIRIRAQRLGRFVRVEVADNGVGVPAEHRERIFRPFERLHGAEVPGAGLGLALCARIVERHGGVIGVEDTPGGGATVYFTLPAAKGR